MCTHAKLFQLYPTLCDPMDCSLPGFSVHEIIQARILEWVAMPSSRGLPDPGIELESEKPITGDSNGLMSKFETNPYGLSPWINSVYFGETQD